VNVCIEESVTVAAKNTRVHVLFNARVLLCVLISRYVIRGA